jgi:sugar fermentation stimulation protein A
VGAQPHRSETQLIASLKLSIDAPIEGRLIRRYKRFLADIELPSGEVITVHCPNPGAMTGTDRPGSAVRCSTSNNPKRKLAHTLEMVRVGRIWVGVHTLRANQLVARALAAGALPPFAGYTSIRPEIPAPGGSRLDFGLSGHPDDPRQAWLEVKSVTLARGRVARFPDSVTTRGQRHLETLARLRERGDRAALLFVVQRGDCSEVECAAEIDPAYAEALARAARDGVEILAVRARVLSQEIRLEKFLPVLV